MEHVEARGALAGLRVVEVGSSVSLAIAGLVLWQFGSGPIRGFAITLLIGIATSIFTAVFAARVFFDWQANRKGFDRVSI